MSSRKENSRITSLCQHGEGGWLSVDMRAECSPCHPPQKVQALVDLFNNGHWTWERAHSSTGRTHRVGSPCEVIWDAGCLPKAHTDYLFGLSFCLMGHIQRGFVEGQVAPYLWKLWRWAHCFCSLDFQWYRSIWCFPANMEDTVEIRVHNVL